MLYLFAGDDTTSKLESYENFREKASKKREAIFISHNDFNKMELESLYSGAGLFSPTEVVVLSLVLEREEVREFVLTRLEEMAESASSFIFLEGKLPKPVIDAFKKSRAEINVFELSKEKPEKFNNFLLANAFGERSKLNLWIYFRQAMSKGVGMEELVGVLFWKAKDMLLRKNFSKYKKEELENFVKRISYLLPQARKEGKDAEAAFEEFLLEIF